jgi:hypothetical protein
MKKEPLYESKELSLKELAEHGSKGDLTVIQLLGRLRILFWITAGPKSP